MRVENHWYRVTDRLYRLFCQSAACLPLFLLVILVMCMVWMSGPSLKAFGWHFLVSSAWNPSTNDFGAFAIILGTLLTSLLALIIAVPSAFCVAILLVMILPKTFAVILSRLIETMAAIPSIIYGLWGLFILAPFLSEHVYPHWANAFSSWPVVSFVFRGIPIGTTLLTAGIVLALMIFPLIASMMRDVIAAIPSLVSEASFGVGLSRFQVVRCIYIHYARAGLLGSIVLGLGRALGETMAVTFVIGNAHGIPQGLLMPGTTISSTIANEFTEAMGELYVSSLIELGLILFVIALISLVISRQIMRHSLIRGGSQ